MASLILGWADVIALHEPEPSLTNVHLPAVHCPEATGPGSVHGAMPDHRRSGLFNLQLSYAFPSVSFDGGQSSGCAIQVR